ncbi:hypothetical protein NVIRENTERO_02717 [Sodalis praecaptivus]|nr:hypothetical protein NVIRENTERO_02717 [Sodalis praecaptivus]
MIKRAISSSRTLLHRAPVRLMHWLNVPIMAGMFMSGWGIYNASPIFPFTFPEAMTLGGWLGGSNAWHLAVMWALAANGVLYVLWGVISGYFRRDFLPLTPGAVLRETKLALTLRLTHRLGHYNAVQKAMYWGCCCAARCWCYPGCRFGNRYSLTGWWRCSADLITRAGCISWR